MKVLKTKEKKKDTPFYSMLQVEKIQYADYQRGLKACRIRRYAQNFDYDLLGVPLVSMRDGKYWCVDGMHRLEALKIKGIQEVLCQVLSGLTYEQEAEKFVKLNSDRQGLSANQKFAGRVESGELFAKSIVKKMADYGFSYNKDSGTKSDDVIGCISCVERITKNNGLTHLERVLMILRSAWYGDASSLSRAIIQGLSTFLCDTPRAKNEVLIAALEKNRPKEIEVRGLFYAGKERIAVTGSASKQPHIAKVIRDEYKEELNSRKVARIG